MMAGSRFGDLTVIEKSFNVTVKCKCTCGKTICLKSSILRKGGRRSCGCRGAVGRALKLVGKKIGKWTIVKIGPKARRGYYLICRCSCGVILKKTPSRFKHENPLGCRRCMTGYQDFYKGKKFGDLSLIRRMKGKNTRESYLLKCVCSATEYLTKSYLLMRPNYQCLHNERFVGKRFAMLLILGVTKKTYPSGRKVPAFECKCDCGSIARIQCFSITSGHQQSCGCKTPEVQKKIIPEGEIFGAWKVIQQVKNTNPSSRGLYYSCKCSCGLERVVKGSELRTGRSKSCGHMTRFQRKTIGLTP